MTRAWLEPLGYEAFWRAAYSQGLLDREDRSHCDDTLAKDVADFDTVLTVIKGVARDSLAERHGLRYDTVITPNRI